MNKQLRRPLIAGNWKMNKTPAETETLIKEMLPLVANADCDVALCVPFVDIAAAQSVCDGSNIAVGAQNCHFEKSGAFTGEISADMLAAMKVPYVIVGHSERRTYFGDTDATVSAQS